MGILTTFQKELIELIGKSELKDCFFLTGGTALAHFYLQHRYSEDLDFWEIYRNAQDKYIGMGPYWLAVALDYIHSAEALPRMIKRVTIQELREFYDDKIRKIMHDIQSRE